MTAPKQPARACARCYREKGLKLVQAHDRRGRAIRNEKHWLCQKCRKEGK